MPPLSVPTPENPSAQRPPNSAWKRLIKLYKQGWVHVAPLVAVVLFLVVILAAFAYLRMEETRREEEALKRDVEYAQQRLRLRLLERQEQLMRLARDIANREVSSALFSIRAEALVAQYPELISINWIDARRQILVSEITPSALPQRSWMDAGRLKASEAENGFGLARDLMQPVYTRPQDPGNDFEPTLQLHVPISPRGQFSGELLVEYGVDSLLRYGVPSEVLAKYAVALLDAEGSLLSGQSIPPRQGLSEHLPWISRINASATPVSPVGNSLLLRAQAWRTSQSLIGSAFFWLLLGLSGLTAWMLIANWRESHRRQEIQQTLQDETSFRRAMENSMLTGMRALDLQGRITYVNPAFCRMTGWTEEELVGQTGPFSYWPTEDREYLSRRLNQELGGQSDPGGFQMRVKRKDGSLFDARLYMSPLVDATGKQTGWMASMTDITEPNRVRRQLAASYERFTTVLEALDASVSVAPLGSQELLFANRLYRLWFDGSAEGHLKLVVRGSATDASSDDSLDAVDSFVGLPLESLATAPQSEQAEIYLERLDKWLEVRSRYLNWVDGRLAQMVIATDITARRQAEEMAAAQAERAQTASRLMTMGEMASSVAHELNQPLTAISNYCTGLISRIRGGQITEEDLLSVLDKTARQAQRAGQVVQHIRSFVKRSEPRRQLTPVASIIEQVVELAEIDLRRRQVRLERQVAPKLPALFVDPILVEQVLMNLIKNGADAIDAAGRDIALRVVRLEVGPHQTTRGPTVQFSVSDTGNGLSEDALGRLYEPFFSTKTEGMGMGLNLCRSIIESHQGRIQAQNLYNEEQVVGCRFTFWIPVGEQVQPRISDTTGDNSRILA